MSDKCDLCEIAKKYQLLQDIAIHYPDKLFLIEDCQRKLDEKIKNHGDFTTEEVIKLLSTILEVGKILAKKN